MDEIPDVMDEIPDVMDEIPDVMGNFEMFNVEYRKVHGRNATMKSVIPMPTVSCYCA